MYKTKFAIEDGPEYEGYTDGRLWNGWGRPRFTFRVACQIIKDMNDGAGRTVAWIRTDPDGKGDSFVFDSTDSFDGPEEYCGIKVDSLDMVLYPIGAGCWIWTELDEEERVLRIAHELYATEDDPYLPCEAILNAWHGKETELDSNQLWANGIKMLDIGAEYWERYEQ